MEHRSFSPVVLAGGLLVAALVGFVAARQLSGPDASSVATPVAAEAAAEAGTSPLPPTETAVTDATEATIEPAEASGAPATAAGSPGRQSAAAAADAAPPAARVPSASTGSAAATKAPARTATSRPATREASRPAPPPPAPAPAAPAADRQADVARAEPTWSRPFPPPAAAESLPTRTAPVIDAPPPPPVTRTVTLPADAVVGLQIDRTVSTDTAVVEDDVTARVTRDVMADGVVVIPAGTRVHGSVTLVDEGGKVRERARLGVRFHTVVFADGTEVRLPTETIYRDGESPAGRSTAKIGGGAAAGALIGAILGGGKGAAIGAAVGAGGGTAATMAGGRRPAQLPAGQTLTVRLSDPVSLEVPR